MEKVIILIDGSNFYHRLKEVGLKQLLNFNYGNFKDALVGKRELGWAKYYIGSIRESNDPKAKELMRNQRRLFSSLYNAGWELGFGHMLKTDRYHEKGVDVLMAVNIIVGAYENDYDTVILVSSDTDLIPALQIVRRRGKKVEYIGFSHKPSYGLITHSDIRRLLTKEDLEKYLK